MTVILGYNLLKLVDMSPLVRNTNAVGSHYQSKAFSQNINKHPRGGFLMFWEGTNDEQPPPGPGSFDFYTDPMRAFSPTSLQGPWDVGDGKRTILAKGGANFEQGEIGPTSSVWDGPNNRQILWGHGGNNTGPRQGLVLYSTDGPDGRAWARDALNPILVVGTAGAFDDAQASDIQMQRLADGTYLGFYKGRKAGSPLNGTVGRITATVPNVLTKQGEVLTAGGAGAWDEHGYGTGGWYKDVDARIHMFLAGWNAGGTPAVGYFYSDDNGATWTKYASNPVLTNGGAGAADNIAGDGCTLVYDGDVLFILYGGENIVDYATNPPIRCIMAAITPMQVTTPKRKGKFYLLQGGRSYSAATATSLLSQNVFTVMGRFKAYRLQRNLPQFRHLYTDDVAFNKVAFIRIQGGSTTDAGKLHAWFRTPTAFTADMYSEAQVDDGQWHEWMFVRLGAASFELWLDGARVRTDATNCSTDATATFKAVGNAHPSGSLSDSPSLCTISDVITVAGSALNWQQAQAIIRTRTFPAGISADFDFPTAGSDSGNVITVEAALNPTITSQPMDTQGIIGGSALFTIQATGIGTLSYQWDLNYVNVGSNQSSYTLTPIVSTHQRNVIRCTVTDSAGSTVSREAVFTLNPVKNYLWATI